MMRGGRLPLVLLLGTLFLASLSATLAYRVKDCQRKCSEANDLHACEARCKIIHNHGRRIRPANADGRDEDEDQTPSPPEHQGSRPTGRQPREDEDEDVEEEHQPWGKKREAQEGRREQEREPKRSRNNPFYFPSSRFRTRYGNQHGKIRVLQRFDQRSNRLEHLQNYRLVEIQTRPHTLVLPKHADAESLLVVQQGNATVHLANPRNRESYNLEAGHALRIPSGTITYIVNPNQDEDLRIAKLVIPVNQPGKFQDFFPASNEDQESYLKGFSKNILEAAFNAPFGEIERILLEDNEEEEQQQQQQEESEEEDEGVIVKLSREQIRELTRHAKDTKESGSSESGPFDVRGSDPLYSNQFGRLFEVAPNKNNPQLQDLDIFLSCLELNQGGLMLPYFNSEATLLLWVNKGRGELQLVVPKDQQQEEEGPNEVRSYKISLVPRNVAVVPAGYPIAINASSDLRLLAFGINAANNRRNFLAGENDNVLNQIHREVKELAFPGSGREVEKLLENQKESHFASAQPQQREKRKEPLFSILGAFH